MLRYVGAGKWSSVKVCRCFQGLTVVHFPAQRRTLLCDTQGGISQSVAKTAQGDMTVSACHQQLALCGLVNREVEAAAQAGHRHGELHGKEARDGILARHVVAAQVEVESNI